MPTYFSQGELDNAAARIRDLLTERKVMGKKLFVKHDFYPGDAEVLTIESTLPYWMTVRSPYGPIVDFVSPMSVTILEVHLNDRTP